MTTRLYELTMTGVYDPDTYREHVFEAPDDTAAVMHALRWPGLNGWDIEVRVTVGRCFPTTVNADGHVETGMSVFQFVTDLNVTHNPVRWATTTDEQVRDAADYIIRANRGR
jgi:hypothetical protein